MYNRENRFSWKNFLETGNGILPEPDKIFETVQTFDITRIPSPNLLLNVTREYIQIWNANINGNLKGTK